MSALATEEQLRNARLWRIAVAGGYGSFEFEGTEAEAEEMRRHKARWEGAIAHKHPILPGLDGHCDACRKVATGGAL